MAWTLGTGFLALLWQRTNTWNNFAIKLRTREAKVLLTIFATWFMQNYFTKLNWDPIFPHHIKAAACEGINFALAFYSRDINQPCRYPIHVIPATSEKKTLILPTWYQLRARALNFALKFHEININLTLMQWKVTHLGKRIRPQENDHLMDYNLSTLQKENYSPNSGAWKNTEKDFKVSKQHFLNQND